MIIKESIYIVKNFVLDFSATFKLTGTAMAMDGKPKENYNDNS